MSAYAYAYAYVKVWTSPYVRAFHRGFSRFIKPILKSLVILETWLVLSGAINPRIALSFTLDSIFFLVNENGTVKQNNQLDSKAFLN